MFVDTPLEVCEQRDPKGLYLKARAGEIATREDVVRVLDKMCDWYARAEPSSPVPLLLRRAKKLVHMEFMDIIRDLASDGVSQVERIRGEEPGE